MIILTLCLTTETQVSNGHCEHFKCASKRTCTCLCVCVCVGCATTTTTTTTKTNPHAISVIMGSWLVRDNANLKETPIQDLFSILNSTFDAIQRSLENRMTNNKKKIHTNNINELLMRPSLKCVFVKCIPPHSWCTRETRKKNQQFWLTHVVGGWYSNCTECNRECDLWQWLCVMGVVGRSFHCDLLMLMVGPLWNSNTVFSS